MWPAQPAGFGFEPAVCTIRHCCTNSSQKGRDDRGTTHPFFFQPRLQPGRLIVEGLNMLNSGTFGCHVEVRCSMVGDSLPLIAQAVAQLPDVDPMHNHPVPNGK